MKALYSSPLRVYLCLGVLAFAGIFFGLQIPVSLFPNSSKPIIIVSMPYGHLTANEFIHQHGNRLESQLRAISMDAAEVEKTRSFYDPESMWIEVEFKWRAEPRSALREVEMVAHSYSAQLPEEIRNQVWVGAQTKGSGFFIASFYSSKQSLDHLYQMIEPVLIPAISKIPDVAKPQFWNPMNKEIRIDLNPERMSSFQLLPKDIEQAVRGAMTASNGGSITVGTHQLRIQVPRVIHGVDDLKKILISTPSKQSIHLMDVAKIDYDLKTSDTWSFKTNGAPSLILFVRPRPGGNIKKMSEEIVKTIQSSLVGLPKEIEYKILVDPSQFIRSAIHNVFHEVALGSFLAVLILFVFIGSIKNTMTAAIEIPLSMVLAFIPMKLSGMTLNLISLGGLALSAGMNVDASVVVMENIFRKFEEYKKPQDARTRLRIVLKAVNEVKFAVISSTVASLVVFIPIIFTSDLSYAILGDLAKVVVFSHGLSAFVALILVPTVRLQMMSKSGSQISHSPLNRQITQLEDFYVRSLKRFIESSQLKKVTYLGLVCLFFLLNLVLIPYLPKEVIGKPDTEELMINIYTEGNTLLKQMEEINDDVEQKFLERFGKQIEYTFINAFQPNQSWIMAHLKNKSEMRAIQKEMQELFTNTSKLRFEIVPFNPAELPIPDPPQLRIAIRGGSLSDRSQMTWDLYQLLEENQVFPRLWTEPSVSKHETVVLQPYFDLWSSLRSQGSHLSLSDLADLVRVFTNGRKVGEVTLGDYEKDIFLRYSSPVQVNVEEIRSIPIGIGGVLIPLKALTQVTLEQAHPSIYQENQRELFTILGKLNEGDSAHLAKKKIKQAKDLIESWQKTQNQTESSPTIMFEDAEKDIHEAMNQLFFSVLISIALIFLILIVQFGDIINSILVLVAIPLGLIGVLFSLFIFQSPLSLNSVLGVILLNGIAVANSILLVDFLIQRVNEGLTPLEAALDTAKKRLRPILITSLTTILGMLPIALGLGEGGRILQPLGIAVSGGLWVSMGLTLIIVPALQVQYLNWKQTRKPIEES